MAKLNEIPLYDFSGDAVVRAVSPSKEELNKLLCENCSDFFAPAYKLNLNMEVKNETN